MLTLANGQQTAISRVEQRFERIAVYNFTVENYSTYTVGKEQFLVHNCAVKVNNRSVINKEHAGKTVQTKGGPVKFDENGFPDFTPYSQKTVRIEGLTGNYSQDEILALQKAKMKSTPDNMVWHHHQDGKSMMLVPKEVHNVKVGGVNHTGGAAVIKHNNNPANASNQLKFPSPPLK